MRNRDGDDERGDLGRYVLESIEARRQKSVL